MTNGAPVGRSDMDRMLPRAFTGTTTWLSGLPHPNHPPAKRTAFGQTVLAGTSLLAGFAATATGLSLGGVATLGVLGDLLTSTAAARYLQLTIVHNSAHGNVISPAISKRIGELVSLVLVIEPFCSYAPAHSQTHYGRQTLSTVEDATVQFLLNEIGMEPGLPVAENRKRLLKAPVSPKLHAKMVLKRLRAQFGKRVHAKHKVAAALYLMALAILGPLLVGTAAMVIGVALPLTIGYQIAQILRLVVEHRWPEMGPQDHVRTAAEHDALTVSIRSLPMVPTRWTPKSIARFAGDLLANALVRWIVLPGDSGPNHHWHHGQARGDWPNHEVAADLWRTKRCDKGQPVHAEARNYATALQMSLESFEQADWESLQPVKSTRKRGEKP